MSSGYRRTHSMAICWAQNGCLSGSHASEDEKAVWQDPEFDPNNRAFYYERVIEIPTPRWLAYDAVRYDTEMREDVLMTTTERAYTSPIWYTP